MVTKQKIKKQSGQVKIKNKVAPKKKQKEQAQEVLYITRV
jgi:hypothetical protein